MRDSLFNPFPVLLFCACIVLLLSFSCDSEGDAPLGRIVLTGRFVVVGNMPFARLAFRTDDGKTYLVVRDEIGKLGGMQGKQVVIACRAERAVLETPNRKRSAALVIIRDIRILRSDEDPSDTDP